MPYEILLGDCLEMMKLLPASSVDAIVTDPPYGIDFMGRGWDNVVPGPPFWKAALRLAKPGAHLLAFGGSRSAHRLACAVEDAGWEIRDSLGWIYASGFPKSLDISKQFDLRGKGSEHLYRFTAWMRTKRLTARRINEITGSLMGGHYLTAKSQPAIPTREFFELLRPHLGEIPTEIEELVERHNRIESIREATGEYPGHSFAEWDDNYGKPRDVTPKPRRDNPASRLAKRWAGWGTALKPSLEVIYLARKPIEAGSDIASNVKRHGTGAINIDGCRVPGAPPSVPQPRFSREMRAGFGASEGRNGEMSSASGRWPANLLQDGSEEAAAVFPDTGKSGTAVNRNRGERAPSRAGFLPGTIAAGPDVGYADGGSAARFFAALKPTAEDAREALEDFEAEVAEGALGGELRALYAPKSSKRDREEGCEDLEPRKTAKLAGADRPEIDDLVSARFRTFPSRNDHPTVKPTALMRYLCRLVTPPDGVVLDPFAGSGSTGKAALLEGFNFLGIEQTPRYVEIAKRRCAHAEATHAEATAAETEKTAR